MESIDYHYKNMKEKRGRNRSRKIRDEYNSRIRSFIASERPEKIIIVKGNAIYESTLKEIRSKGIPTILYLFDALYRSLQDYSLLKYFNKVLIFEGTDKEEIDKLGIKSEFFGTPVYTRHYYPISKLKKDIDIAFVGSIDSTERSKGKNGLNKKIVLGGKPKWQILQKKMSSSL